MPDDLRQRRPRRHDPEYLEYIRQQACCICGNDVSVEAHHPRTGTVNGENPGMGQKISDKWALPLCGKHHRAVHSQSEQYFWASYGIDPFATAMQYRIGQK